MLSIPISYVSAIIGQNQYKNVAFETKTVLGAPGTNVSNLVIRTSEYFKRKSNFYKLFIGEINIKLEYYEIHIIY